MKRVFKFCFWPVWFIPLLVCASKKPEYPISEIPDSLKKNAAAVLRYENITLTVPDVHGYTYKKETVISVLKPSKEYLADIFLWYDDRTVINNFKAWLYDADGNLIKAFEKHDAQDYSANPNFVLAGDGRIKYMDLKKLRPPYTVKYIEETETQSTFQLPRWLPVAAPEESIETASFSLVTGPGVNINIRTRGVSCDSTGTHNYLWKVNGFCADKDDDYGDREMELFPHVYLMAKEYELYGLQGRSDTWNDIGLFINKLTQGRETLDAPLDNQLAEQLNAANDEKEKIKIIYKYLQSHFRYVCVAEGIEGWQPQDVSFTMQKKYGDCKALSMEMKALLKKAGIDACMVLVTAGKRQPLYNDFPYSSFNHAILCVPLAKDTVWLECTSSTDPFNYLGDFTADRRALMIYNGGAALVQTPVYGENENLTASNIRITAQGDNPVSINATVTKYDEQQDNLRYFINKKDAKDIESSLYNSCHLNNCTIAGYSITKVDSDKPVISFTLKVARENTIKQTESRLFVETSVFNPLPRVPVKNENRVQPFKAAGFTQTDTLIYALPKGFVPENFKVDEARNVTDKFGYANCDLKYQPESGELKVVRSFCLKHGTYSKDEFTAFREFLVKAEKIACPPLVLKKRE